MDALKPDQMNGSVGLRY